MCEAVEHPRDRIKAGGLKDLKTELLKKREVALSDGC